MELILKIIEELRQELNKRAKDRDLTDPEVVSLSQELDRWLNAYQEQNTERETAV